MNNKKSLLQDSLQELENIKNESLELAKEQLINESADLLEKKSAALFEKLIAGEDASEEESKKEIVKAKQNGDKSYTVEYSDGTSKTIAVSNDAWDEINNNYGKSNIDESSDEKESKEEKEESKEKVEEEMSLNEILSELEDYDSEEDDEESDSDEEMDSDEEEMDSDEEEMSLDSLRKAAEEHGFKLVADTDDNEEEMDSDEEEMGSDEEELDNSDDEEDIEFGDEKSDDEFSDVNVDDKVLAEPSDEKENTLKINENFKRNNTKMRNTKKQVLKDLRDVSFNKLVEAYYNMDESDSFVVNEYDDYEDDYIDIEDDPEFQKRMTGSKKYKPTSRELKSMKPDEDEYDPYSDVRKGGDDYGDEEMDEEIMYEIDMPQEDWSMDEMSDDDINEMLSEMDVEETMHDVEDASGMDKLQKGSKSSELEEMFEEMSMEELEEMSRMLEDDGGEGMSFQGKSNNDMKFEANPKDDYMSEEAEIEEMLNSMQEQDFEDEGMEESSTANSRTTKSVRNMGADDIAQGRPDRRSKPTLVSEEEMEEGDEQLDEFWGGAKAALGKVATDISKLGSTAKQAVGQYAQELGRQYNSGEVANEVKKLETLANNLGRQVGALNSRLQKAGKSPLPASSLIATLANQIRSGGNISLANTKVGQGLQEDEVQELQEQLKKLQAENKSLNEGFTNKVKSLENKVYDVTISALKAGFVNKFLLEHPLRENEKLQIIHRFANAQTKEQIKETYISLTNEFAKGQTVKDGSMLNESVQTKVGKVHRTDNAIVTEKNLMNENDESNRFKQLLNYNFGKRK